jgi:hypothetical protein
LICRLQQCKFGVACAAFPARCFCLSAASDRPNQALYAFGKKLHLLHIGLNRFQHHTSQTALADIFQPLADLIDWINNPAAIAFSILSK